MNRERPDPLIARHNFALLPPMDRKKAAPPPPPIAAASEVPAPAAAAAPTPTCAPATQPPLPATIKAEAPGVYEISGPGLRGYAHFDGKEWGMPRCLAFTPRAGDRRCSKDGIISRMLRARTLQVLAFVRPDTALDRDGGLRQGDQFP
jgi:hypothetical protein